VLIIDDSSKDETFIHGLRYQQRQSDFKITVLRTPKIKVTAGTRNLATDTRSIMASTSWRSFMAMVSMRQRNCPSWSRLSFTAKRMPFSAHA